MASGSYAIGANAAKDTSFRTCLCALLVFIAICAILLLSLLLTKKGRSEEEKGTEYMRYHGSPPVTDKTNEKNLSATTHPTTTPTTTTTITTPSTTTTHVNTKESTPKDAMQHTTAEYFITEGKLGDTTQPKEIGDITSTLRSTVQGTVSTPDTTLSTPFIDVRLSGNDTTTSNPTTVTTPTTTNTLPMSQTTIATTDSNSTTVKDTPVVNVTSSTTTPTTVTAAKTATSARTTTPKVTTEYIDDSMNVVEATGFDTTETPPMTPGSLGQIVTTTEKEPEPICLSSKCKSVASAMLGSMNHSVDPCEDFYEFACGGMKLDYEDSDTWLRIWDQTHHINETSPQSLQTYKTFYDSCVSHEYLFNYEFRTIVVQELVKEVGNFMDTYEGSEHIDITKLFAYLILRRSLPIMEVALDIDKETSKFILTLSVPSKVSILLDKTEAAKLTDLQNRCLDKFRTQLQQEFVDLNEIHDQFIECQKDYTVYLFSIQTAAASVGFFSNWTNTYNRTQVMQDLRTTIEWDVLDHSNALPPPNERRESTLLKDYTLKTISDLQIEYPFLQWTKFFKILTEKDLGEETLVQVYFPDYFEQLFAGLSVAPLWKINNALIAFYANHLYETLVIPRAKDNREFYCLQLSTKLFRDITSHLYIKTWSPTQLQEIDKFLSDIFETIKKNLALEFKAASWLDDDTKKSMLIKAKKMVLTFGKATDSYNDVQYLNEKYKDVELRKDTFMKNVVKMLEFDRKSLYKLTGKLFTIDYLWNYFISVFDSRPTSFYTERLIMAPIGMMSGPLSGTPGYITMSRIGLSLAREIGHYFDPVGIQNDMKLTPAAKATYDAMVDHMKQDLLLKANQKTVKNQKVSFTVYPNLSANERIADNTGMRLIEHGLDSLRAENILPWISTTLSREQIFYISIAQDYCRITNLVDYMLALLETESLPPSLKVENIVTNSEKFAEIFHCPKGSEMNNNPMKIQFPNLVKHENSGEL